MAIGTSVQLFLYSGTSLESYSFELPLSSDIAGTSYTFQVPLASSGTTNFVVSAILRQNNGTETTLASAPFTAASTTFRDFTATVSGPDPRVGSGDVLIVRIQSISGSDSAILMTPSHQSFLTIQ